MSKESFSVGTNITVGSGQRKFGPLNIQGLQGTVALAQDAGDYTHCIEILISRIYKPRFWLHWSKLAVIESEPIEPDHETLADHIGGRYKELEPSHISMGCLRSWMHLRVRPAAGHPLELLIMSMKYEQLLRIFNNTGETKLADWLAAHDMRPKRARIDTAKVIEAQIKIHRPKMRG